MTLAPEEHAAEQRRRDAERRRALDEESRAAGRRLRERLIRTGALVPRSESPELHQAGEGCAYLTIAPPPWADRWLLTEQPPGRRLGPSYTLPRVSRVGDDE